MNYLKVLNDVKDKKDVKQVVIKATGAPGAKVLGNRFVAHRLNGEVLTSVTDATSGITTVTMTSKAYDERSAQEAYDASQVTPDPAAATPPPAMEEGCCLPFLVTEARLVRAFTIRWELLNWVSTAPGSRNFGSQKPLHNLLHMFKAHCHGEQYYSQS